MTLFEMLFFAGAAGVVAFMLVAASGRTGNGSWPLTGLIGAVFLVYSVITIAHEGPVGFYPNHVSNYWGAQVWLDLVMALSAAVFLAIPRARKVGMMVPLWLVLVLMSGSIGLFAMLTRLFWLEARRQDA